MDCSAPIYARKRAKTKGSRMITEECQHCRGIGGYTSQQNPDRIVERCGACGGAGEIEVEDES